MSGFGNGAEEKGLRSIEYRVRIPALGTNCDSVLWHDPSNLRMVKRTIVLKNEAQEETITETYEQLTLNGDVAEERFKPPEDK